MAMLVFVMHGVLCIHVNCLAKNVSYLGCGPTKLARVHLIVIPWARVVCLIYTPEARGPQARGLRVYISGEPRLHMV